MFLRRKTDKLDRFAGALARDIGVLVAQECARHDVGQHRHAAKRPRHLECARQAVRANVMWAQADHFLSESQDRTCIRPEMAGDEVKTLRLAGSVRPDESERFTLLHRKADVLNGTQSAEPLAQVLYDERLSHRGLPLRYRPVRARDVDISR